jgi:hypothetical protein
MMDNRTERFGFLLCGFDKPVVFQGQPADMPGARCHSIRKSAQGITNTNTRHKYINTGYGLLGRRVVVAVIELGRSAPESRPSVPNQNVCARK